MTQQKLPLFPLNSVLFPGAPLTLHIFEERYRLMIARCLEQETPFGVVLIREGEEVGQPAVPHEIGTAAQITKHVRLEDGRYYLAAVGQRRFRIQYTFQKMPYMVASVSMLPEESGAAVTTVAQELHKTYDRYWQAVTAATGFQNQPEQLSEDVVEMTYQLAHRLQVSNERKQRWLETDVATRMHEIATALRTEMLLLPRSGSGDRGVSGEWSGLGSWN